MCVCRELHGARIHWRSKDVWSEIPPSCQRRTGKQVRDGTGRGQKNWDAGHLYLPKQETDNRVPALPSATAPQAAGYPPTHPSRPLPADPKVIVLSLLLEGKGCPERVVCTPPPPTPPQKGQEAGSQAKVLARRTFPHRPAHLSRRHSGPCAPWRLEHATAESSPPPLVYPRDHGSDGQTLFRGGHW